MTSWNPDINLRLTKVSLLLLKKGVEVYVYLSCHWISVISN